MSETHTSPNQRVGNPGQENLQRIINLHDLGLLPKNALGETPVNQRSTTPTSIHFDRRSPFTNNPYITSPSEMLCILFDLHKLITKRLLQITPTTKLPKTNCVHPTALRHLK